MVAPLDYVRGTPGTSRSAAERFLGHVAHGAGLWTGAQVEPGGYEPRLRVLRRQPGPQHPLAPIVSVRLRQGSATGLVGLDPGSHELRAEYGPWDAAFAVRREIVFVPAPARPEDVDPEQDLAALDPDLLAGALESWSAQLGESFTFDQAPVPPAFAELSGYLGVPRHGRRGPIELVITPLDPENRRWVPRDLEVAVDGPAPKGARSLLYPWVAGRLPVGRYQVFVRPFGTYHQVTLEAAPLQAAELQIDQLAELEIQFTLAGGQSWTAVQEIGVRSEPPDWAAGQPACAWTAEGDGTVRAFVAPGLGAILLNAASTTSLEAAGYSPFRRYRYIAGPERRELEVPLRELCRLRFEFWDGDRQVTRALNFHGGGSELRHLSGDGRLRLDRQLVDQTIELSEPGWYLIEFQDLAPYAPVSSRRVEALRGHEVVVRVELLRDRAELLDVARSRESEPPR